MLLIHNIGLLATPLGNKSLCGQAQGRIRTWKNAAVLIDGGAIVSVTEHGLLPDLPAGTDLLDAGGRLATPGLIDAHTHLIFGGWRDHEVPLKLSGAGYLDILRAGGGILHTLKSTRAMDVDDMVRRALPFLSEMLRFGVTAAEIKSGYGLDLTTELNQLRAVRVLQSVQPLDLVPTYLGAHAVPPEYEGRADDYVDFMIDTVLPAVANETLAEYCDVFCETGVFSTAQARRILTAAHALGLGLKIHADEIDAIGGSELSGALGAASAEHLIAIRESGMAAMAQGGVTAMLLPQTSLYLNKPYAPARTLIEHGVPVALATDFNPGSCPSLNLPLSMTLGSIKYRMTPKEVLTAVTLNAACAIGRGTLLGSAEPGKQADLVLWDADDLPMLCYRLGANLVHQVIKKGQLL